MSSTSINACLYATAFILCGEVPQHFFLISFARSTTDYISTINCDSMISIMTNYIVKFHFNCIILEYIFACHATMEAFRRTIYDG